MMTDGQAAALADPAGFFAAAGRPRWTCRKCGEPYNGVVGPHPLHRGDLLIIPPPQVDDCMRCKHAAHEAFMADQARREREGTASLFLRWSDIGPSYLRCSFDNFETRRGTKAAVEAARSFVDRFGDGTGRWLLLFGDPGGGKTHLGMAIRNALEAAGQMAIATTQPHLLREIQASWRRRPGDVPADARSEEWMLDHLQGAKALVLDDLGPWKEWADDMMFTIIDSRYRNARHTVFTSNYTPDELENMIGRRLWSRFAARTDMVPVTATDYRIEVERGRRLG